MLLCSRLYNHTHTHFSPDLPVGVSARCTDCCFDQVVRESLHDDRKVMTKSSSVDLVTQTDQKVEQLIIQSVKEKFPTHR